MLKIYGYSTFNPFKVVATAEELGAEYEYVFVDLGKRANHEPDYQDKHPFGKVPVLEVDGQCISESPSICRYLARTHGDRLYSADPLAAAHIDSVKGDAPPAQGLEDQLLFEPDLRTEYR